MHYRVRGLILFLVALVGILGHAAQAADVSGVPLGVQTPAQIEELVRVAFTDAPVMVEIARCESKFRQFTDSGAVFYGGVDKDMVGIFQFYEAVHRERANILGFDLTTVEGNIGFARHLYDEAGVTPWQSCVPINSGVLDANLQLRLKLMAQLLDLLQQLLALKLAEQ